jgi:hypothetical protein
LAKLDKFFVNSSKYSKFCVAAPHANRLPLQNAKPRAPQQRHISKARPQAQAVLA